MWALTPCLFSISERWHCAGVCPQHTLHLWQMASVYSGWYYAHCRQAHDTENKQSASPNLSTLIFTRSFRFWRGHENTTEGGVTQVRFICSHEASQGKFLSGGRTVSKLYYQGVSNITAAVSRDVAHSPTLWTTRARKGQPESTPGLFKGTAQPRSAHTGVSTLASLHLFLRRVQAVLYWRLPQSPVARVKAGQQTVHCWLWSRVLKKRF